MPGWMRLLAAVAAFLLATIDRHGEYLVEAERELGVRGLRDFTE